MYKEKSVALKLTRPVCFLSVLLFLFSGNVFAEYYLAYSSCCHERCYTYTSPHKRHKAVKKYHKPTTAMHRVKVRHKTMRSSCFASTTRYHTHVSCDSIAYKPQHHYKYRDRYNARDDYNPDMSTGDDNSYFYPGMNIDR